jgi:hypothetical protein
MGLIGKKFVIINITLHILTVSDPIGVSDQIGGSGNY